MTKVYIIDDDPLYLSVLSTKLWQDGFTVRTLETVETALELIKEEVPDAIVLDHNFKNQDKSGYEHLPTLRKYAPKAAVLYITSENSTHIINEALNKGADKYLLKDKQVYNKICHTIRETLKSKKSLRNGFWKRLFK